LLFQQVDTADRLGRRGRLPADAGDLGDVPTCRHTGDDLETSDLLFHLLQVRLQAVGVLSDLHKVLLHLLVLVLHSDQPLIRALKPDIVGRHEDRPAQEARTHPQED